MKGHITKSQFLIISLMLFSMFFGAGNFIFPPMVGREAGENVYEAIMFFCLTAVALPVLGVAAIAKVQSMDILVRRVDPVFAVVFTLLIYITIGPAFAIPRAANMPFEVSVAPMISSDSHTYALLIYTCVYFLLNYIICINPSKMVETLGKFLTPIMLVLIAVLFIVGVMSPMGEFGAASGKYAQHPIASGFLDGYQTMDALASIVFAIVVINAMRALGIKNRAVLVSATIKAGILAGAILMSVYMMLAYLGASSGTLFTEVSNGANLLSQITYHLFGEFGRVILGAIFLLACLTTTVGLIGSASEYFSSVTKLSYKFWVVAWSVLSFCVANAGLDAILKFSIPVLIGLYPVTIVLIILALIDGVIEGSKLIYRSCIYVAVVVGILSALGYSGISLGVVGEYASKLPFFDTGLGWIVPEIVCFMITYIVHIFRKRDGI
ncbi:branched-chain amino acid transport system II carrier protein [Campylobacter geochelonis]|uniref:Branched-chain amino acid transport system II carrier protein n=1 Tax=Campylobacter geochelonis TaxID=1780362 RepID=A0A128EET1_9BACT|nr:branched-chain amino acid transport system II carrier protein [Campylobacter geochelonis]QKF71833.1 branched-chain amino acid transport system II carrier protein [Campylobacter geochelonis]CZE46976.1 branched-chain amino acid transport system II carrier protein [Campylobacter geochelonis]CZE47436.1 branched-chain amino acid transport system II carrier protein [Campylobacter geochelonis]CZE50939.1 branched-chain amino acid transport system II carrier protein [Campylobacter geochelonis]